MDGCLTEAGLNRYHAGELGEAEDARVREHLSECQACARLDAEVVARHENIVAQFRGLSRVETALAPAATPPDRHTVPDHPSGNHTVRLHAVELEGYQVIREIHRGGQGVVYQALQISTKRKVAIKVLLEGPFASEQARGRFEREIELVASLQHPNIISVFHSGETPHGQQYCVMDYVQGLRLDEYVREKSLTLEETLRLFATVGEVIQYAHQMGVIHRDLKPQNILVDAQGSPKVLDFGLAKMLAGPVDRVMTVTRAVLGTLPYMSPEQARGNLGEVDTRTDIYALGVILYELLTGHFPYPVDGHMADVLKHITETPPTPPSHKWSSNSGITRRSARRPRSGECPIDDEVQTIILKTLAKERQRRYQSAGELARDIQRYLAGEPIDAKRDSGWYVVRKFIGRHSVSVTVATAFVLLVLGATIGLTITLKQVQYQRDRANTEAARADRRFNDVRTLANTFLFDFDDKISNLAGSTPAREFLVQTALKYLDGLASEGLDQPRLQHELLTADFKVGDIQGHPYSANLGDTDGALASYRKSLQIAETLSSARSNDASHRRDLILVHNRIGDIFGGAAGKPQEALASYNRSLKIAEDLYSPDPTSDLARRDFAYSYERIGEMLAATDKIDEALASYHKSLSSREALAAADPNDAATRRELAVCCNKIGDVLRQSGKADEALANYRRSLEIAEDLYAADPTSAVARRDLAYGYNKIGQVLAAAGSNDQALACYYKYSEICQALLGADPTNATARRDLAISYNKIGDMLTATGDTDHALRKYRTSLRMVEELHEADPSNAQILRDLAVGYYLLGRGKATAASDMKKPIRERRAHWCEARASCQRSLDLFMEMRERRILPAMHARDSEVVATEIARCDAAIAELDQAEQVP